jgi:apolipoprotein N-acyltransferase
MKNLLLVALAAVMMSFGWWELTGLVMLGGFVPLLVLAARHDASRRSFWRMAGWTALFIALWYGLTIWWVWFATPAGPIAATFFAWVYTGAAFMLWFWISKRAPKSLSYTVLVSAWTLGEWLYNTSQASFPWLSIGNGFAHDTWAIQWYEFTGEFGGTVWVLVCSILIYEFLIVRRPERRRRIFATRNLLPPALAVVVPLAVSLAIFFTYEEPARTVKVTIVQPNIPAWEEDSIPAEEKAANLAELAAEAPADARFIVMPETTIGEILVEGSLAESPSLAAIRAVTAQNSPRATVVVGAMTRKNYGPVPATPTVYRDATGYFDAFNAALAIAPDGRVDIHHKAKMVIGAEMMPTWWWVRGLQKLVSGLQFYGGHYGFGTVRQVFSNTITSGDENKSAVAVATGGAEICWESVYGEYTSEFARNGAEILFIVTNDGWWRNTPGHRQHFDLARLRAIETRRAIARSANTGRSGFITSRGDVRQTLEWDERGTITADVALNRRQTLFTRLGDWPARVSLLTLGLSVLYFIAWRVRRKNNLV